jgi:hypothetical protein
MTGIEFIHIYHNSDIIDNGHNIKAFLATAEARTNNPRHTSKMCTNYNTTLELPLEKLQPRIHTHTREKKNYYMQYVYL